ncbi:class I SAM-dependent methyltransferase [Trichloromonas sp.]|uniref:class I SAM-dependent methyltransferase n=1 Tax=Trichloromonas sp. TaxID=3069249 RepID=UPI003D816907
MELIRDEIRRHLPQAGEARRLFHGRGHSFAGYEELTIDSFGPVLLVILYQRRSQPWLDELAALLRLEVAGTSAVLLQERFLPQSPSRLLWGELPDEVDALEGGLRFRLRLGQGQNIGFFPDMAVGRELVRKLAAGRRVLNLFAYTCSFSVAALAGGARQVVNLDMNKGALELGRFNHRLNGIDTRQVSFLPLELFRSFGKLLRLGPFDLVISDPPATQGASFTAERHWPKLLRRLPELLAPGADIIACRNGPGLPPGLIENLVAEQLPSAELLGRYLPGEDFPEAQPEQGVCLFHYRVP